VLAIAAVTGWLEVIRPSSRFWLRDVLEKFSEPMKTPGAAGAVVGLLLAVDAQAPPTAPGWTAS